MMNRQAIYFKDDILKGISFAIKNLQAQDMEVKTNQPTATYSITKYNPHFRNLINSLDLAFSFGLKDAGRGYWPFIKRIAHSSIVQMIEEHKKATTDIRKGYIWLFLTFTEQSLDCYMKMMMAETKLLKFLYRSFSLLRDTERAEILMSLLIGIEHLSFAINFDDPYLDYGHDPVLRQEKVVIRVQPSPKYLHEQQPDVTIFSRKSTSSKYPDVVNAHPKASVDSCDGKKDGSDDNIVHKTVRHHKKKRKIVREQDGTVAVANVESSVELEDDNFIPEIPGSPEYCLCVTEPVAVLQTSDPFMKQYSLEDNAYKELLKDYHQDGEIDEEGKDETDPKEVETIEPRFDSLKLQEKDYQLTFVSDDGEEESFAIYRADSFDKFCRGSECTDDILDKPQSTIDHTVVPIDVAPKISKETMKLSKSPIAPSLSKENLEKLNTSRLNMNQGILLPSLPRRPSYAESAKQILETSLDENKKVLLSLQVFDNADELFMKMFEVSVGYLNGEEIPVLLTLSNQAVYLIRRKDLFEVEYQNLMSICIDSINKIQIGLNYQDLFIFHDKGCAHLSTADEAITKLIVLSITSAMLTSVVREQPVEANTHRELMLVIKDWLICHSQCNEDNPEPFYFSLVQYAPLLASGKGRSKIMKVGYMRYRESLLFSTWQEAYFTLRGHILHRYSIKKSQQLKSVYDLSVSCGGCIRAEDIDGWATCKIIGNDGVTPLLELALSEEHEANEWLLNICQAVADSKNQSYCETDECYQIFPVGTVITNERIMWFNQDLKSGRLVLRDSCDMKDVAQVYVDNEDRTYCAVLIDHHFEDSTFSEKRIALLQFRSEFELGKFEREVSDRWQFIYQVPLQFVLLGDSSLKQTIRTTLKYRNTIKTKFDTNMFRQLLKE